MTRWGLKGLAVVATVSVLVCSSSGALAEYRHRVLLLERANGDDSDREITTRVRAELGAAGFDVVVLPVTEEDPKLAVESAGPELHPASVILVERLAAAEGDKGRSPGSELWLADRMLRKTVVLRLKPADGAEGGVDRAAASSREAARVAVQAVELVKARLAELAVTREHQPPAAPPAPPPPPPRAPPPLPELRGTHPNLTAAVGFLEGFHQGQQALTPVLRLGVPLPERWTGEVLALELRGGFVGLGRAARIEHGRGAATLRHTAVSLDAVVRFMPRRRVQPFVSLGGGMLALDVAGDAPAPLLNSSTRTLSGLVEASAGIWLQPLRGIGLALEGQLMNAWSKTIVRITNEEAAEVAAPLLLMSAGLMVEF
jgi:hypothetical protein